MKNEPKIYKLELAVFDQDIFYTVGATEDQLIKRFREDIILDRSNLPLARTFRSEQGYIIVWINPKHNTIPIIAHEVFHCVEFCFDRIGIKHSVELSGEAYAYSIQHLMEQILKLKTTP